MNSHGFDPTGREARPRCAAVRAALWVAGIAALAGCTTVGPNFVKPVAPLPPQWQAADDPILARKPADQIRWWDSFGDAALDRLITLAYQNNVNLKIAGLRVLEARAQLGIAVGTPYPQLQQAVGGATYTSASENAANTAAGDLSFWQYSVGANVGWEIDFWGKFRRGIESADAGLLASIAAYDNALVLLVAQVADTYVAIRSAEEQLRVAHDNVVIQQRSFRITEARFRGGDIGELDMLQARTQLLGTQAAIPPIEAGLQQAKNALATLLGQPPGDLAALLGPQPGVIPAAPQAIVAGVPTDLLRRRPDVRQAELAAQAQSAAEGVAEADLYPSFGLTGFLGVVSADGTNTTRSGTSGIGQLFSANALTFVGGPYFSWNILNYGRIRNNVRVQDARLQQLLESYQNTVLTAVKEVEDGMVAMLRSREQERILAQTEAAAQRSLTLANVGYREGISDFQRVLDAQNSLLRAQQQNVAARGTTVSSAIGIYRALGGGWEIRDGNGFVDAATRETMRQRANWGELLQPRATTPPVKGEAGGWPAPDW